MVGGDMSTVDNYRKFLVNKQDYGANNGFKPSFMPSYLFDFQTALCDWAIRKGRGAIFADCGLGKGQPINAKVLTPNGWETISNLKVGDKVISSSGKSANITGVYPKQPQNTYRFYFSDRTSFVVDEDHLHTCRTNNDRQRRNPWRVMSTLELLSCGNLRYGKGGKSRNYDIPIVDDVVFNNKELPIDPYVIGALLGDGCLKYNISLSSSEQEIIEKCKNRLPDGIKLRQASKYDWRIITGQRKTCKGCHPFRQKFKDLGLYNILSHQKFIPQIYLYSSVENRLGLLQGLMDTDGYIAKCGTCQYYTVSNELADNFVELLRSLGGIPTRSIKQTSCNGKKGKPCHVITFSLATHNPFSLSRKAERWNESPRDNGRWIDRIEFEKIQPTICIAVDSPDNSYVTENYIVTHNTVVQLVWAQNVIEKTNKPVLILTPLAVSGQTLEESEKFGIESYRANPNENPTAIQVTNYEKLHYFDSSNYAGIVCDESSILKNFDGTRKSQITEFMRKIPYRLLCTATAAPNDWIELGTSSEALGYLGYTDMLSQFFTNKRQSISSGHGRFNRDKFRLRGWATQGPFWQWVVSWARAARKPSDLGFDDAGFILPPLIETRSKIKANRPPDGMLFELPAVNFHEEREAVRRTIQERCEKAAEKVLANGTSMVWCHLNDESALLKKLIPGSVEIKGSDKDEKKEDAARWFCNGKEENRVLISKPRIFGFGMNFQHCNHMTYFPTHSMEQYYQATRRLWRFGQTKPVTVDLIYTDGGERMMENLARKAKAADEMFNELIQYMNQEIEIKNEYTTQKVEVPQWMSK